MVRFEVYFGGIACQWFGKFGPGRMESQLTGVRNDLGWIKFVWVDHEFSFDMKNLKHLLDVQVEILRRQRDKWAWNSGKWFGLKIQLRVFTKEMRLAKE